MTQATNWLKALAIALPFALGACGSGQKGDTTPTDPPAEEMHESDSDEELPAATDDGDEFDEAESDDGDTSDYEDESDDSDDSEDEYDDSDDEEPDDSEDDF